MGNSDLYLVNKSTLRKRSALTVILCSIAWALLFYAIPEADMSAERKSTHISIPSPLFDIARTVCQKNGGYREIVIDRRSDIFTFKCQDGMTLRDTIVRIDPKVRS